MLRRCTTSLALLTVALIGASGPSRASAASIVSEKMVNGVDQIVPNGTPGSTNYAYYSLVNTQPKAVNDLVYFSVDPAGSVVADPNNATGSPVTVVHGSSGFNTGIALAGGSFSSSDIPQGLGLDFSNETGFTPPYNNPLAAGGVVNFKLSLDPSYASLAPPSLSLLNYTSLSLNPYTPDVAGGPPPAQHPGAGVAGLVVRPRRRGDAPRPGLPPGPPGGPGRGLTGVAPWQRPRRPS